MNGLERVMATINQTVDHDTAVLVSEDLGHAVKKSGARDVEAEVVSAAKP